MRFLDPFESIGPLLSRLRDEGADVIVVLSHLEPEEDRKLARRFPEVNLILGASVPDLTRGGFVSRALIARGAADARALGQVDLIKSGEGTVLDRGYKLRAVTERDPVDPLTQQVVESYEERLNRELDVVVGTTRTPLDAAAERVRAEESNLGNLMADAMREDVEADIAILNAGSIRSNRVFPPGELTLRDIVAIHPFGGVICKIEVSGATVLAALNHGVGRLGESVGRFPQVSGVTFTVVRLLLALAQGASFPRAAREGGFRSG